MTLPIRRPDPRAPRRCRPDALLTWARRLVPAARALPIAMRACLVALVALLASPALAQQIRAEASLSSDRIYVGDSAVYQITLENVQSISPPALDAPPGLDIHYAGAASQPAPMMTINGRRVDTGADKYILQYRVTPAASGTYTIPEQTLTVAGQVLRLSPVRLTVLDPPPDRSSILELELSSHRAYVGEPITLTATWHFLSDVQTVRFMTAGSRDGYDLLPNGDPPTAGAGRLVELQLDGQTVIASVRQNVLRQGREYTQVSFQRTIVPTRPGRIEIGPLLASAQVRTGERSIGILLTEPVLEPRVSRSDPVTLEVRPLPEQGRPPNFSGLVGTFSIQAQAAPTSVNVGDPIDLRVTIRGPGPLERVQAPDLTSQPPFASEFRISGDGLRPLDDQPPRARIFTTTVRAMSPDVRAIPPIELPYFDTASGSYQVARSEPIPLEVRPTRVVTAHDALAGPSQGPSAPLLTGPAASGPVPPTPLVPASRTGLLAGATGPEVLRSEAGGLRTLLVEPAWAAGIAAPPLAFVAALAYRTARGRTVSEAQRSRRAAALAIARLRASRPSALDRAAPVASAIRDYIAERFDLTPAAVTSFEIRRLLGDSPEADRLASLLDRADAARLHPSESLAAPPTASETIASIRASARHVGGRS